MTLTEPAECRRVLLVLMVAAAGLHSCSSGGVRPSETWVTAAPVALDFGPTLVGQSRRAGLSVRSNAEKAELLVVATVPDVRVTPSSLRFIDGSPVRLDVEYAPTAPGRLAALLDFRLADASVATVPVAGLAVECGTSSVRAEWRLETDGGCTELPWDAGVRCTPDACHPIRSCTGVPGGCVGPPLDCDDGLACTADSCGDGGCLHTLDCPAGPCQLARCAVDGGCATTPSADGAACDSACVVGGQCLAGVCQGPSRSCDDGNACTRDLCDADAGCRHVDESAACPLAFDSCRAAACDPVRGCITVPAPDGTPCGALRCGERWECQSGTCAGSSRPAPAACSCLEPHGATWRIFASENALATCLIGDGGVVSCWGDNTAGQLGDGVPRAVVLDGGYYLLDGGLRAFSARPRPVVASAGFTQLSNLGGPDWCGLTEAAELKCWGLRVTCADQLATVTYSERPTTLETGVRAFAGVAPAYCIVRADGGAVQCTGDSELYFRDAGLISAWDGPRICAQDLPLPGGARGCHFTCTPQTVFPWSDFTQLTTLTIQTEACALRPDGRVVCWGRAHGPVDWPAYARLADGGVLRDIVALRGLCAVSSDGKLFCRRRPWNSPLGVWGATQSSERVFEQLLPHECLQAVSDTPGDWGACVVTQDGGVRCVGTAAVTSRTPLAPSMELYPLPWGDVSLALDPREVVGLSLRTLHGCVAFTDGGYTCWGRNRNGALGDGTDVDRPLPY